MLSFFPFPSIFNAYKNDFKSDISDRRPAQFLLSYRGIFDDMRRDFPPHAHIRGVIIPGDKWQHWKNLRVSS